MFSYMFFLVPISLLNFFLVKFTMKFNILDLLARSSLNTFYINNFYFFWTSLWYLYFFFFTVILYYLFSKLKFIHTSFFVIVLSFFLVNYILYTEAFFGNTFTNYTFLYGEHINILLKNSVNKIHPLLLYSSSYIFFLFLPLIFFSKRTKHLYSEVYNIIFVFNQLRQVLVFILVALFLGSWWALQEGSWGGWWNWDPSEFFGLIILYFILSLFHNKHNINSNQRLFTNLVLNISYLFTFFLLLQLNFSLISHNFGFRNLKFLNIEILLFLYLLLFLYMFCTFLNSAHSMRGIFNSNYSTNLNFQFVLQVILILFNLIVLTALLSFFLKTLLSFKFFFSFISFNKLLVLLFLCFYIKLFYLTINSGLFYINVFLQNYYVIFYVTTLYNYKLKYLSHYLIFLVVALNLLHKHNILNDYIYVSFNDLKTHSAFLSINNREIELLLNFFSTSSTFESKSFSLEIGKNYLYQIYFISNTNWHFSVTTVDSISTIIHTSINLLVITFSIHFTNRSKFY